MKLKSKEDYRALMKRLLDPLKPLYSPGGARLRIGGAGVTYNRTVVELEAFSRPLWALVPFWAGGGRDAELEAIYQRGLANGTDPDHPEYWGGFEDYDQRFVEMAAIANGLLFVPEILWEPLSERARDNLSTWLYGINTRRIPDCNWHFFRVLVNIALKKRGQRYSSEKTGESLAFLETCYLGNGWYRDGASCQKDYYVSFAFHYYGLIYAEAEGENDPDRARRYRERAAQFAQDFIYWFAESGAALPYGRSLTYRFGQAAFWAGCLFAKIPAFSDGVIKGLLARHWRYWAEQDIFDRDGVLTVGYAYPNLLMAERYNAPGSPYWGMKLFLLLALPDEDPFWQCEEAPLPSLGAHRVCPEANLIITRGNGDVIAYPAGVCERDGHGHVPEKYAKFAYSCHFGFSCARSQRTLHESCPDSMLALIPAGSDYVFVRERSIEWEVREDAVVSVWLPFPGIRVRTTVTPTEHGHRRRHEIDSEIEGKAYDCGFAVEKFCPGFGTAREENAATAYNERGFCTVRGGGEPCFAGADPNTNLLYRNSEIPALCSPFTRGHTVIESEILTGRFAKA